METINESRRTFLKASAAAGGGLLIGCHLPGCNLDPSNLEIHSAVFRPNAWIRIAADDTVTIIVDRS